MGKGFCIEVSGPYACFTRPEMKVERVSYDVMTPAAARAIFEAIFWKPAIRWHVSRIDVLNPIRWISIRRNEVGSIASSATTKTAMNAHALGTRSPIQPSNVALYVEEERQQRAGLILRDVRYRLYAQFERLANPPLRNRQGPALRLVGSGPRDGYADELEPESDGKYAAMFERRARRGQCFNQPYLGCREFSCDFRWVDLDAAHTKCDASLVGERDLGFMLFDMDFGKPPYADPKPTWFRAQMSNGVIDVPRFDSDLVMR